MPRKYTNRSIIMFRRRGEEREREMGKGTEERTERLVNSKFFPADINCSQITLACATQFKLIQDKSYCGSEGGGGGEEARNILTEMCGLFHLKS